MILSDLIKALQNIEPWAGKMHVEVRNSAGDFDYVDDINVKTETLETDVKKRDYHCVRLTSDGAKQ